MWTSYLLYQEFFWGLVGIKKMIVWKIKIFWVKRKPMDSVLLINHCTQLFFLTKKKLISELNRWIYVYQIDKDGFHRHIKFWFFFFTWQFIIICKAMHSITVKNWIVLNNAIDGTHSRFCSFSNELLENGHFICNALCLVAEWMMTLYRWYCTEIVWYFKRMCYSLK